MPPGRRRYENVAAEPRLTVPPSWRARSWVTRKSEQCFAPGGAPSCFLTGARGKAARHVNGAHDEPALDGAEPVRRVFRNENPIAFRDVPRRSAFNRGAIQVRGIRSLLIDE